MNRVLIFAGAVLGASSLLLIDSAIKGAALLLIATVVVLLLRRDSAATRHFVWLVAIVGLLVVPVFSAVLPQWRVLPAWATISAPPVANVVSVENTMASVPVRTVPSSQEALPPFSVVPEELPTEGEFVSDELILQAPRVVRPPVVEVTVVSPSSYPNWGLLDVIPLVWAFGFAVLVFRLSAARLMLWSSERRGTVVAITQATNPDRPIKSADDRIVDAFQAACRQLGVRRRVRLLIHSERTIPVVWGIIRIRLLLPESARTWSDEQLQSVLLHELGHIKRGDAMTQLLGQLACALHWFNPAVWFASWRMHVERERACDDLVLSSGVKPSAYAEHLLDVATRLSPAKWTQACGLAMARKSSLEGRLRAVLNKKRNRRSVSATLGTVTLVAGVGIAIPIAMLQAAIDQKRSVDEQVKDQESPPAAAVELTPEHRDAQKLFSIWQANARTDGKIPGALIGQLGEMVKYFNQLNKDEAKELVAKFEELLPRFDATVDWSQADAVDLLNDVTAVHRIPLHNALDNAAEHVILTGEPLPAELADAPWGEPAANGLRVAWHLSPIAKEHRIGTSLKSRILVHNSGKDTVFFIMPSWQQSSTHTAHDANDKSINVSSTYWTTRATLKAVRLAPDACFETPAPAIGVGTRSEDEDWANIRPGAWIEAKAGDDVRLTPGRIEVRYSPRTVGTRMFNGRATNTDPKDAAELWDRIVTERLDREMPLPTGAADREQLLRRVVRDLFGLEPSQREIDAYVADKSPGAMHPAAGKELLKIRVLEGRSISPFTGTLPSGDVSFRVLAADPDAATKPRVATGPGYYNLADKWRLQISQSLDGNRRINNAEIRFLSYYSSPAREPYAVTLPEGRLTYAIVWERNATELWVVQSGMVRRFDFTDPASVKETRFYDKNSLDDVHRHILDAARSAMPAPNSSKPANVRKPPDGGAMLVPEKEALLQWGEPVNGLRAALIRPPALGGPESPMILDFQLVIQNVSDVPIHFVANTLAPNPRSVTVRSRRFGYTQMRLRIEDSSSTDVVLQPGEITLLDMTSKGRTTGASISRNLDTLFTADMTIEKAPPGAWTGKIVSAEMHAAFAAHGLLPKHKDAREVFKLWNQGARLNRTIPGGLIGLLADSVTVFTKSNPTWKTTPQLLQLLPRLDASRDWEPHDVVALLDEVAAIQASPVSALLERERAAVMRRGKPLPKELSRAPWGKTQANGLRLAWLLEPQKPEVEIGTALKSRILVHNSGDDIVVFRTRNWHQSNDHKAQDTQGSGINVLSMRSTMRTQVVPFRLNPGDYVELPAAAVGVGRRGDGGAGKGARVGSWIEANVGDDVTFQPAPIALLDDRPRSQSAGKMSWWHDLVTTRLHREMPVPMDDEVRKRLVYHVGLDLGTSNSDVITEAFLADRSPDALDTLARRLVEQSSPVPFAGTLSSGATTFRVLAAARKTAARGTADSTSSSPARVSTNEHVPAASPAAATPTDGNKPATERPVASRKGPVRSANHSGSYQLKEGRRLVVCRPTVVKPWLAVVWDAIDQWPESRLRIYPKVSEKNYRNWAVVWEPDADDLWFVDDSGVTHVDVTNPAEVLTTRQDFDKPAVLIFKFPEQVRQEFRRLGFEIPRSKQSPDNHVTDGQAMLAGESLKIWTVEGTVTGQDGRPMTDVPIRIRTEYHPTIDVATTKTDAKGNYRVNFRLDLRTIARYRGVQVEPVLDGFTERDAEESGLFDALLHVGEKPHSIKVRRYPPMWITGSIAGENEVGPIRRFSKRDLILGQSARADFVMLPGSVITGEIVDPGGNPQASRYVSVSAPDTVRPRGYETVASAQSDKDGRFKLTNIPANELLNFTSSIPGRNWEVSKSASQIFGPAATYRVRIVTGPQGGGSVLKVDRMGLNTLETRQKR